MKTRKILTILSVGVLGATLTACQNTNKKTKVTSALKTSKISVKKNTHHKSNKPGTLSPDDLTPRQNASVITVYGSEKYGKDWTKTLNKAETSNLAVSFHSRDDFSKIDKGEGYVYQVAPKGKSSDTYYTLDGNGSSQDIYFYQGNRYLGSATIKEIVTYLNKLNRDDLVNKLAGSAKIGNQKADSGTDDSDSGSQKSGKSNIPGDAGEFTMPSNMQGTWYGYYGDNLEEITIGAHTLKNEGGTYQLHKQSKDYDAKYSESVFKQTEHILRTVSYKNPNYDFDGIGTRGWVQPTGGTDVYAPHTEAGQAVIVNYNTSGGFQALLWKSPELAKKNKDTHFSDLKQLGAYINDSDNDDSDDD